MLHKTESLLRTFLVMANVKSKEQKAVTVALKALEKAETKLVKLVEQASDAAEQIGTAMKALQGDQPAPVMPAPAESNGEPAMA